MALFERTRGEYLETVKIAFERKSIDLLKNKFLSSDGDEIEKRSIMDQVLKDVLLQKLYENDMDVSNWEEYILFSISACREEITTATLPVILLGDIFDSVTLDQCEKLFAFVENGVGIWKEELFFSACKNHLLRMCNDLLRRLSRSQNTVFCGRILLFLAKFFPFSERSGLNIISEFNLDNVTEFGNDDFKDSLEGDEPTDDKGKLVNKFKNDYNLYCKFWALQDFFRNPNQCYNNVHWKVFQSHTNHVLSAFDSYKLEEVQSKRLKFERDDSDEDESNQLYFAKFLTNQKLMELQISDSNFRRYILLQFLILFQYLQSQVKFKAENHELKEENLKWIEGTTEKVYNLIIQTPPDGLGFFGAVKHILKREDQWNSWKNDGCPEFQKPISQPDEPLEEASGEKRKPIFRNRKRKKLGELLFEASEQKKYMLGNSELTKLWNLCPDNLEACKVRERDFLPTLEEYFEEAIAEITPSSNIKKEDRKINDINFGWRGLRLLARKSPHFFTFSNNQINEVPDYLETMINKIVKDRPQNVPLNVDDNKVEPIEAEVPDAEVDELLKTENVNTGPEVDEPVDEDRVKTEITRKLTDEEIGKLAVKIGSLWKRLAGKLGYTSDEMEYFVSMKSTDIEQAHYMLKIWNTDDDDASPENLCYILEGLDMMDAAEALKDSVTDKSQ